MTPGAGADLPLSLPLQPERDNTERERTLQSRSGRDFIMGFFLERLKMGLGSMRRSAIISSRRRRCNLSGRRLALAVIAAHQRAGSGYGLNDFRVPVVTHPLIAIGGG